MIELLLFDDEAATKPARVIPLDPMAHRTYHYWHAFVPGLEPGQIYAYRAHGPFAPERGLRFDGEKVLLDPYGLAVAVPDGYDRGPRARPGGNAAVAMKSVVADPARYDWEGDRPLNRPFAETIIYELHVRGFTRHPSSGVSPAKRRHIRRIDREDSLSQRSRASPRSSCCRCFSSILRMRRQGA